MKKLSLIIFIFAFFVTGCMTPRPRDINNVCRIFRQYPKWYWATQATQEHWGVPISVQMAIMHQESRFTADARPPRRKLLWIIPWTRPTSSYGYTQALRSTWERYKRSTNRYWVSRSDFADAADFIGWYVSRMHQRLGLAKNDAYHIYLAYHEGMGGFERKTYLRKRWLIDVARGVKWRAGVYHRQLVACASSLPSKPWYRFW